MWIFGILAFSLFGLISSKDLTVKCKEGCKLINGQITGESGKSITLQYIVNNANFNEILIKFKGTIMVTGYKTGLTVRPAAFHDKRFKFPTKLKQTGSNIYILEFTVSGLSITTDNSNVLDYALDVLLGADQKVKGSNVLIVVASSEYAKLSAEPSDSTGLIVGIVFGGLFLLIIVVALVILGKRGYLPNQICLNKRTRHDTNQGTTDDFVSEKPHEQGQYAELSISTISTESKPLTDKIVYANSELGPGGRIGPKPSPYKSKYAQVKTDADEYHSKGPSHSDEEDDHILV